MKTEEEKVMKMITIELPTMTLLLHSLHSLLSVLLSSSSQVDAADVHDDVRQVSHNKDLSSGIFLFMSKPHSFPSGSDLLRGFPVSWNSTNFLQDSSINVKEGKK